MKKPLLLTLILTLSLASGAWGADLELTVGVLADTHWFMEADGAVGSLEPERTYLENAIDMFNTYGVQYIIMPGDMFDSFYDHDYDGDGTTGEADDDLAQITDYVAMFSGFSGHIDACIGNHDKWSYGDAGFGTRSETEFIADFQYMSALNYSRTIGSYHFMYIENCMNNLYKADDATLTWLETEVAKLETGGDLDDKYGILVCHYPIYEDYPGDPIEWEDDDTAGDEGVDAVDEVGTCTNFSAVSGVGVTCECTGWTDLDPTDIGTMVFFKHAAADHTDPEWGGGYITNVVVGTPTILTMTIPAKWELQALTAADKNSWGRGQSMGYDALAIRTILNTALGNGAQIKYVFTGHQDVVRADAINDGNGTIYHYVFPAIGKVQCWSIVYLYDDGTIGIRNGGYTGTPNYIKSYLNASTTDQWHEYFVDLTNGNDGNSGVYREDAFKTLVKGQTETTTGNNLTVMNGTLNQEINEDSGTADDQAVYTFENVTNNRTVTYTDWAGPDVNGWYTTSTSFDSDWCQEDGVFLAAGNIAAAASAGQWGHSDATNTLYYCPSAGLPTAHTVTSNSENRGIDINATDYFTLEGLEIVGCQFGIDLRGGNTGVVISNVTVRDCYEGVQITDAATVTFNNLESYHHSNKCFEQNTNTAVIVINNGLMYDSLWGAHLKKGDITAYNLTLVTNSSNQARALDTDGLSALDMKNCIMHSTAGYAMTGDVTDVGAIDYSCFYGTISSWGGLTGSLDTDNLIAVNPRFWNASTGDFRLKVASPCRDAGATIVGLTTDIRGRMNGAPDIGAFEGRGRAIMLPDGTFLGYQP